MRNGVGIGCLHYIQPGESGDQHEKRGFRQVEVGHQPIHQLKAVTRGDENPRFPLERVQRAIRRRDGFKNAQAGGAWRCDWLAATRYLCATGAVWQQ